MAFRPFSSDLTSTISSIDAQNRIRSCSISLGTLAGTGRFSNYYAHVDPPPMALPISNNNIRHNTNSAVQLAQSAMGMSPPTSEVADDNLAQFMPQNKRIRTRETTTADDIIESIETAKLEILFAINSRNNKTGEQSTPQSTNNPNSSKQDVKGPSTSAMGESKSSNGNNNEEQLVNVGGSPSFVMSAKRLSEIEKISGCPITFSRKVLEHFVAIRGPEQHAAQINMNNPNTGSNNNKAHRWLTSDERLLTAVSTETMARFQPQCMILFQSALKTAVEKRLYAETMYRKNKTSAQNQNNTVITSTSNINNNKSSTIGNNFSSINKISGYLLPHPPTPSTTTESAPF